MVGSESWLSVKFMLHNNVCKPSHYEFTIFSSKQEYFGQHGLRAAGKRRESTQITGIIQILIFHKEIRGKRTQRLKGCQAPAWQKQR